MHRALQEQEHEARKVSETITALIHDFVDESCSQLAPYVDMAQSVVKRLLCSPIGGEPDQWTIGGDASLEGALAAAGAPEPQQEMLVASALTIAAVVTKSELGRVPAIPADIHRLVKIYARRFGAGRRLAKDLDVFLTSRIAASSDNGKA